MAPIRVTYIIASTMRTGSYLLCEALEATKRAGHPMEIFCPERREDYEKDWLLPPGMELDEFMENALWQCTSENGVCGMKIHGHHVEPLAREYGFAGEPWQVLRRMFPAAKYIHLTRRNRRAQAISWYRAEVTNQWWKIPGVQDWDLTGKEPQFDGAKIRRMELELDRQAKAWERFFAVGPPVEVLEMEYETLAADYRGQVARTLALIGEDPELAKKLPEPRMVRQADATSEAWMRRMEEEFPR
jgi:trehalose 2-sulfotransferase